MQGPSQDPVARTTRPAGIRCICDGTLTHVQTLRDSCCDQSCIDHNFVDLSNRLIFQQDR